jgi:serine O-acetyltransferase
MISETSLAKLVFSTFPEIYYDKSLARLVEEYEDSLFDACSCAVSIYRLGHEISRSNTLIKSELLKRLAFLQRQIAGCEIYFSSEIGRNFLLVHGLGTVIGSRVICGDDVTVYQNVTIGTLYDTSKDKPKIGDGVIIYAGAKVLGDIEIGSDVVIGANSVVTKNVPNKAIVVGSPAKIIGYRNNLKNDKYKLRSGLV